MQVVSKIRHKLGRKNKYVLRATLPVPQGTFPRHDGQEPLSLVGLDGSILETSTHPVSFYPNKDADGASVVEIQARFKVPAGYKTGQNVVLDVVENPHELKKSRTGRPVRGAITSSIKVVGEDFFGNRYEADIGILPKPNKWKNKQKRTKVGSGSREITTYMNMEPVNPSAPNALEKLMGVRSVWTLWHKEDVVSLDLWLHNAHSGLNGKRKPNHHVYFKSLELWIPEGWNVVHKFKDPMLGGSVTEDGYEKHTIVAPLPGGNMHMMPQQGQMLRRMALCEIGNEEEATSYVLSEGLGFCTKSPWSWWTIGGFGSQGFELPWAPHTEKLLKEKLPQWHHSLENKLANGVALGSASAALGWANPIGGFYGGITGGGGIDMVPGVLEAQAALLPAYNRLDLLMRSAIERQRDIIIDHDGLSTTLSSWLVPGSPAGQYFPGEFYQTPFKTKGADPFGFKQASNAHEQAVTLAQKRPPYRAELLQFDPQDLQHYNRYTRYLKMLVWLSNDHVAKHLLQCAAETCRMSLKPVPNNVNGGHQGFSLYGLAKSAVNNPNKANGFGRDHGWCVDVMSAAYATSEDDDWRAGALPWFQMVSDVVVGIQGSCNGMLKNTESAKLLNGNYKVQQTFELILATNGLASMTRNVFADFDTKRANDMEKAQVAAADGIMNLACPNFNSAPKHIVAIAPKGSIQQPLYCKWSDLPSSPQAWYSNEGTYCFHQFAVATRLTSDPTYLNKALAVADETNNWKPQFKNLTEWLDSLWVSKASNQNFENLAYLYAIVQAMQN